MRIYIILAALAGMVGAIGGAWYIGFSSGKSSERAYQAVIIEDAREEERAKVKEVIQYRDKIKVVYRDKIKQIVGAVDTTNCLDVKYVDMGVGLYSDRKD